MSIILPILLFVVSVSFGLGLVLPIMTLDRLFVFTEEPSLLQIILGLKADGEQMLALLVVLFSVLFPTIKILALFIAAFDPKKVRRMKAMSMASILGKWSMMDVLLVALVIFAAKTSGLAVATTQPGLWFYGFATLGAAVASMLMKTRH